MTDEQLTEAGWPRPVIDGWSIPWVSPVGNLGITNEERIERVRMETLCQVCGHGHDPGSDVYLLVMAGGLPEGGLEGQLVMAMDNAVMHDHCVALAVEGRTPDGEQRSCPKLKSLRARKLLSIFRAPIEAIDLYTLPGEERPQLGADGARCRLVLDLPPS